MITVEKLVAKMRFRIEERALQMLADRVRSQVERYKALGLVTVEPSSSAKKFIEKISAYSVDNRSRLDLLRAESSSDIEAVTRYFSESVRALFWFVIESERVLRVAERHRQRIAMPPGRYLGWFGRTFFALKTQTRVIEPLISDYQHEVFEAIRQGQLVREHVLGIVYGFQLLRVTIGKSITAIVRFVLYCIRFPMIGH